MIARVYECELTFDPLPVLSFEGNGFEATEESDGQYYGFRLLMLMTGLFWKGFRFIRQYN